MKKAIKGLLMMVLIGGMAGVSFATIIGSKHDLSIGSGHVESNIDQVCVFCHYPHNGNPAVPLWNHNLPANQTYNIYWSDTMNAQYPLGITPANLGGTASILCLSCHDGTVAVNSLRSYTPSITADIDSVLISTADPRIKPTASVYIGTDLSNDHPIAITPPSSTVDPGIRDTSYTIPNCNNKTMGNLLRGGMVHCVSCHEPHTVRTGNDWCGQPYTSATQKDFVRIDLGNNSKLCLACHNK